MIGKNKQISLIGREHSLKNVKPLSHDAFSDLVRRRALSILHIDSSNEEWENNEKLRKETEQKIFEKIHKSSNLLSVDFLYKGVEKAKAICRITTASGARGTGFLIDNGVIITNHHVIEDDVSAEGSYAEFDYEENKTSIKVNLKPSELFITSPMDDLDFTIIACDTAGIEDIKPVKLLRNPTTITRGEYVNIIQHPQGRRKEVALQENNVVYVYDKVLHYTTDTEPGSSGSAVFNNKWQLVALHHAGWYTDEEKGEVTNEGIKISSIVNNLISLANSGDENAWKIIKTLEDTSPYFGFYDIYGLSKSKNSIAEVEIPYYKGDDRFADIGFWNIEHFNNRVNDVKMKEVSKVIANLSMDALGLVEVEKDALDRLVASLKNYGATMNYVYFDAHGAQDLSILYDVNTTKVDLRTDINSKYKTLLSKTTSSGKSAFPEKREPLFAKCSVKENNKDVEFLMIVVHLKAMVDPISTERRKLATNMLSIIIEDLRKNQEFKDIPIVLGGDFNDKITSNSLLDIADSKDLIVMTKDDEDSGHLSYVKSPFFSLIDHILVSKDINIGKISNDDIAIVRLDKSLPNFIRNVSDHVPLVMRIMYKPLTEYISKRKNTLLPTLRFINNNYNLEKTLLKLQFNQERLKEENNSYYDKEKDKLLINNYYSLINFNISDRDQLYINLNNLLTNTHKNILSYKTSRKELYSWVDLREDGTAKSIYSGKSLDIEELIRQDFIFDEEENKLLKNLSNSEETSTNEEISNFMEMLEVNKSTNIEHTVPQSWFNKQNPMKGDLHHLFICDQQCNSYRSNYAYYDFVDYNPESFEEGTLNGCGKREDTNNAAIKFEPENGKGEVARAVLYFLLRYPNKIKNSKHSVNIQLLLQWNKEHPVTLHEKHRNFSISQIQGNRNPLIDFPQCSDLINFLFGL